MPLLFRVPLKFNSSTRCCKWSQFFKKSLIVPKRESELSVLCPVFLPGENLWARALETRVGTMVSFSLSDTSVLGKLSRGEAVALCLLSLLISLGNLFYELQQGRSGPHYSQWNHIQSRASILITGAGESREPPLLNCTHPECSLGNTWSSLSNRWESLSSRWRQDGKCWRVVLPGR